MTFEEFIAPVPAERFMRETYGKRPLYIAADQSSGARRSIFSWQRLNELLSIHSHAGEDNIKLVMNSRAVTADHYIDEVHVGDRMVRRADAAKVHMFLGMGASLVVNNVEDVAADVRDVTAILSERLGGRAGANAYCSFQDVQAFASHCDLHEVFAVQLDGEKRWRIYENRAVDPVQPLQGPGAQELIDRSKGRVLMEVRMRPGDLLYIPRGYFHDALASSDASLHLTFSVTPLNGRVLFRMLEEMAVEDPQFRAYLADARSNGGADLNHQLGSLAEKVAAMIRSPLMLQQLEARQRALATQAYRADLPSRPKLDFYARTESPAEVVRRPDGSFLRRQRGEVALGVLGGAAEWALAQQAFSVEQLTGRFPWLSGGETEKLIGLLAGEGLFVPYQPSL